ncbi:MAG: dienelactone hydrolase family protein [Alphaproteobacteria bacterium]|mgnify:FL=1|nr:dienelactone hydrolase family protein [Alphaproteobacteria bacterium]
MPMILVRSVRDGYAFRAYHAPAKGARKGGLVLVQEIFGVTDHIRQLCDEYAADGYEVLAPSLYDRQERGFEADYTPEGIAEAMKLRDGHDMADSVGDVQSCIDRFRDASSDPVYVTGYCYGGSVAWVAACRCKYLAAASGYYGRAIVDYLDETPRCPVMLHFGKTDASIPPDWVDRIEAAHPEVQVFRYDAGHGFNSDRRKDYDMTSAELARQRTLAHFAAHRTTPPPRRDQFGNPV